MKSEPASETGSPRRASGGSSAAPESVGRGSSGEIAARSRGGLDSASPRSKATLFPVFLKLTGRRVVLVGGGRVAAAKLPALVQSGADVVVVAPEVRDEIRASGVFVEPRAFRPEDLDGAWYVVAAATPEVNRQVALAAERRRIFVNAVDDKDNASAYLGGVVERGGVTVALSTGGDAPAVAGLLRQAFDDLLPEDLDRWVDDAAALRAEWKRAGVPMEERRPMLLEALNRLYDRGPGETKAPPQGGPPSPRRFRAPATPPDGTEPMKSPT